jgi:hypothetical protein
MNLLLRCLLLFQPLPLLLLPFRHELAVGLVVHDTSPSNLGRGALYDLSDQLFLLGGSGRCFLSMREVVSLRYISISLAEEHPIVHRERTHRLLLTSK